MTTWTSPVSPADVAVEIGADPSDQRLIDATAAAWDWVVNYLDPLPIVEPPEPDPLTWEEPIRRATIGLAVDLFRLPSTAFGYFVNDSGIASTGSDPMRRWGTLLDPYRQQWGIA